MVNLKKVLITLTVCLCSFTLAQDADCEDVGATGMDCATIVGIVQNWDGGACAQSWAGSPLTEICPVTCESCPDGTPYELVCSGDSEVCVGVYPNGDIGFTSSSDLYGFQFTAANDCAVGASGPDSFQTSIGGTGIVLGFDMQGSDIGTSGILLSGTSCTAADISTFVISTAGGVAMTTELGAYQEIVLTCSGGSEACIGIDDNGNINFTSSSDLYGFQFTAAGDCAAGASGPDSFQTSIGDTGTVLGFDMQGSNIGTSGTLLSGTSCTVADISSLIISTAGGVAMTSELGAYTTAGGCTTDLGCGCDEAAPVCGVCDGSVVDSGCGCGEAAPDACGTCDGSVVDSGCGCGEAAPVCGVCDGSVVDSGCGCGEAAPVCGVCDGSVVDSGCGCGEAAPDACGTCDGSIVDLGCGCGVAGPSGCDSACGSTLENDLCGVCDGDNSSCEDCAGTPNGDALVDNCGACDADASNDCDLDACGVWGGDDSTCLDLCGVPNGDSSSCEDCAGVPNGSSFIGCSGSCDNSLDDECGVCDGDGSTCDFGYSQSSNQAAYFIDSATLGAVSLEDGDLVIARFNGTVVGTTSTDDLVVQGRDADIVEDLDGDGNLDTTELCLTTGTCDYPENGDSVLLSIWDDSAQTEYTPYSVSNDGSLDASAVAQSITFSAMINSDLISVDVVADCSGSLGGSAVTDACNECRADGVALGEFDECGVCYGDGACFQVDGLSVSGGINEMFLSWTPNANAASYNIYRDGELAASTPGYLPFYNDPPDMGWQMGWLEAHCYVVTAVSASDAEYTAYSSSTSCGQTLPYALAGLELDGTCADPSNRPAPCEAAGIPNGFLNLVMINLIPVTGYQATLSFDPEVMDALVAYDGSGVFDETVYANGNLLGYSLEGDFVDPVALSFDDAGNIVTSGGNLDIDFDGTPDAWRLATLVLSESSSLDAASVTASLSDLVFGGAYTHPELTATGVVMSTDLVEINACNSDLNPLDDDGCTVAASFNAAGCADTDGDDLCDAVDACPLDAANDADGDGICGDVDACPLDAENDADGDGVCESDEIAGCQDSSACNYDSAATDAADCTFVDGICETCSGETDGSGTIVDNDSDDDTVCDADEVVGCQDSLACNYDSAATDADSCTYSTDLDACATCSGEQDGSGTIVDNDADDDGVCDADDACANFDDSIDADGDGVPDDCDSCPADAGDDSDNDGVCDGVDQCPGHNDNTDSDSDGTADGCDACPLDADDDADGDGFCGDVDLCEGHNDHLDADLDGVPDGCDVCMFDPLNDDDNDGVCGSVDQCPGFDDNVDTDGDGTADGCDACANDADNDADGDGVCGDVDTCDGHDDALDADGDGTADGCDASPDGSVHFGFQSATEGPVESTVRVMATSTMPLYGYQFRVEGATVLDYVPSNGLANVAQIDNFIFAYDMDGASFAAGVNQLGVLYLEADLDGGPVTLTGLTAAGLDGASLVASTETWNQDACANGDGDAICTQYDDCPLDAENDADGDGVCESDEVLGCMDSGATNYSADATEQDFNEFGTSLCTYASCEDIPTDMGCLWADGTSSQWWDGWWNCSGGQVCGLHEVTFELNYPNAPFTPHVQGSWNSWCGDCFNSMSDDDGDGVWTHVQYYGAGESHEYKFASGDWGSQETVPADCGTGGDASNRTFTSGGANTAATYANCWSSCNATCVSGCVDASGCNYNDNADAVTATDCTFVDGVCETCSGETDGSGAVVDNDADDDTVCDDSDQCADNDDLADQDSDGVADGCDACPADALDDSDNDGSCDSDDICQGHDDALDADSDTVADGCDVCHGGDDTLDADGDSAPDACDADLALHEGNNLVSFVAMPDDLLLSSVFSDSDLLGVIGEGNAAASIGGSWYGSLSSIDASSGYWVQANSDQEVDVFGSVSDDVSYTLHDANNLLSYPYAQSQSIGDALPSAVQDEVFAIVGEGVASINLSGFWAGSLSSFSGGSGYWFARSSGAEDVSFEYNTPGAGDARLMTAELPQVPEAYLYTQSTEQGFYFVDSVLIDGEPMTDNNWIVAYNDGVVVGARMWNGEYTDIPAMGNDSSTETAGYMEVGGIPTFKLMDTATGEMIDLYVDGAIDTWASNNVSVVTLSSTPELPSSVTLNGSYPNPFNPATTISFSIPSEMSVDVKIYDISGRIVGELMSGVQSQGLYEITWDASNYASGLYFVRLVAGTDMQTQKIMLVK